MNPRSVAIHRALAHFRTAASLRLALLLRLALSLSLTVLPASLRYGEWNAKREHGGGYQNAVFHLAFLTAGAANFLRRAQRMVGWVPARRIQSTSHSISKNTSAAIELL
jgi:hypothetical protein